MKIIHIPLSREYDIRTDRFKGAVTVEIDGKRYQIQAERGLDREDAETLARQELEI